MRLWLAMGGWLCATCLVEAAGAPTMRRFSLPTLTLALPECVAMPGAVPVPLSETNLNLEIVDWSTAGTDAAEPGEFRLKFRTPTPVGTMMVYGAGEVEYEGRDGAWQRLERKEEAGRSLQILPFPPGSMVGAIRIRMAAQAEERGGKTEYRALLPYLTIIPMRLQRLSEGVRVMTSSVAEDAAGLGRMTLLTDGTVDAVRNFATVERPLPVSDHWPEWVMLAWDKPALIRGIWLMRGREDTGWGDKRVDVYVGKGDPWSSGTAEDWLEATGYRTMPGPFRAHEFTAFLGQMNGTALRVMSTNGVNRLGLGEVVVMQEAVEALPGQPPGRPSAPPTERGLEGSR